jgi:hypothetical protein
MSGERNFTTDLTRRLVLDMVAGRSLGNVAYSDGTTGNRRIEHSPGSVLAGGLPVTINVWDLDVPTSNPSVSPYLFASAPTATLSSVANALAGYLNSADGALRVVQFGATVTDKRELSFASFRAAYSGRKGCKLTVTWASGDTTTNPTILLDGVDITASFALTTGGTAPNWLPSTLDTTKFLAGYNWPAGRAPMAEIGLGAWTAAEHQEWVQTGRKPTWWDCATGSASPIYTSDFSSTATGWNLIVGAGTLTANIDDISGRSDCLRYTVDAATGVKGIYYGQTVSGERHRFSLSVFVPSTNASLRNLRVQGHNNGGVAGGEGVDVVITPDTWNDIVIEIPRPTVFQSARNKTLLELAWLNASMGTTIVGNGTDVIYVRGVEIRVLGPVIKPILQPGCPVLPDSGANMLVRLAAPGMTILGPKPPVIEIPIPTMSADGFILADQTLVPEGYKLADADIQRVSGTSTGTVTIRETSSGGTVLASGALGATPVEATRSNVFSAGSKKLHLANSSWSSSSLKGRLVFQRYQ